VIWAILDQHLIEIAVKNGPGGGGYLYQSSGNSAHFNQFNVGQDESNFDSSHHASNNGFEPLGNSYISTPPLPPPFFPGQDDRDCDESTYSNQAGRNLMISESSSFSSQINHDVLQEIFDLSEHDLSHARRLLEVFLSAFSMHALSLELHQTFVSYYRLDDPAQYHGGARVWIDFH
jgi:hypothetical protein